MNETNWFKENLRVVEHWVLLISGIVLCGASLFFGFTTDILFKTGVEYLLFVMVTGCVGGALMLTSTNINLFDVKKNGLILGVIGSVLAIGSIVFYPIFFKYAVPGMLDVNRATAKIIGIPMMILTIIGTLGAIVGTVSAFLRAYVPYFQEDEKEIVITASLKH